MAAYRWVYDTHQLQADCQEPGSAPKPHGRQSSMDYLYLLPVSFSLAQLDLLSTQQFRRSSGVKLQGVNSQGVAASPRVCVCWESEYEISYGAHAVLLLLPLVQETRRASSPPQATCSRRHQ